MNGSYVLIMEMKESERIEIGKLGSIDLKKGYYAYVGSAMNGLAKRIERHLSNEKKTHWHIDYLLKKARIIEIWILESNKKRECEIAEKLDENLIAIERFGSSDCKCNSHLFYGNLKKMVGLMEEIGMKKKSINNEYKNIYRTKCFVLI